MTEELKIKLGQMFMIGIPGTAMSQEYRDLCAKYKIGNFCMSALNCATAEILCELVNDVRAYTYAQTGNYPFFGIDQEGGWVTRFYDGAALISNAMSYSAIGADHERMVQVGSKLGRILRAVGCNMNLAPVMDVNINPNSPCVSTRIYSDDPEKVAQLGTGFLKGIESQGVMTTLKHFPGHGNASGDTHFQSAHNKTDRETLRKTEFIPFKRGFESGAGAVMGAHATHDAFTDRPAILSPEIMTELLRNEMGFEGIAITDSMDMRAIADHYPKGEGAVQAILAGCDIVLYYPSNCRAITEAVEAVYAAVESGRISEARIRESFRRIQKQKEKYDIAHCEADLALVRALTGNEADIREAFEDKLRSITCLKNDGVLGALQGKKLLCIAPVCDAMRGVDESRRQILSFAQELCKEFEDAVYCVSSLDGVTEPVRDAMNSDYDVAILGIFNADIKPGQLAILEALQKKGKPVVAVLLNSPYDRRFVESCNAIVTGYEYTILSVKALIRAIKDNDYRGTLPVRI